MNRTPIQTVLFALAVAENKLMHPEICEDITEHFKLTPMAIGLCDRFTGSKALKVTLAKSINGNFALRKKIN